MEEMEWASLASTEKIPIKECEPSLNEFQLERVDSREEYFDTLLLEETCEMESNTKDEGNYEHEEWNEEDFYNKYVEVNQLGDGQSFGDLALIEQKPRMASIRSLEDTHFAVISKRDFSKVLMAIERKIYNEKV